jgi:hypothetical protein
VTVLDETANGVLDPYIVAPSYKVAEKLFIITDAHVRYPVAFNMYIPGVSDKLPYIAEAPSENAGPRKVADNTCPK